MRDTRIGMPRILGQLHILCRSYVVVVVVTLFYAFEVYVSVRWPLLFISAAWAMYFLFSLELSLAMSQRFKLMY